MDSTIFENNLYLNDVLKLETSQEYKTIVDTVSKNMLNYFKKTYKKLHYHDFVNTNDFYVQQIHSFMEVIPNYEKKIEALQYGQILQNFIISLEKPVMLSTDNKQIKSAVSNMRSFLIKNKQQSCLIYQLEAVEEKSKQDYDYLMLLEKLCVLIKTIFDVEGDTHTNKNYKLYSHITKCLTQEKFLEEKNIMRNKNRMITGRLRTDNFYHFFSLDIHEVFNDREIEKKIFYRANTDDEEDDKRSENILNEFITSNVLNQLQSRKKRSRLFNISEDAADPVDARAYSENNEDENASIAISARKRFSARKGSRNNLNLKFDKEGDKDNVIKCTEVLTQVIPSTPKSYFYKTLYTEEVREISKSADIFENFSRTSKKLKILKGDILNLPDFDESLFSIPASTTVSKNFQHKPKEVVESSAETQSPNKMSSIVKYMNMEEFKIIRERNPTPTRDRTSIKPVDMDVNVMKRSLSKERLSSISSPKNCYRMSSRISKLNLENKFFPIFSNSKSTIQVPPNYQTNDPDLKLLCDLINEPTENVGWKKVINDKTLSIHKKAVEGFPQILLKTVAFLEGFTKDEIFEAISNVKIRMQWDKVFSEFKIVETNNLEQWEVLYMSIKSPSIFVDDRDFVQKRKIWRDFPDTDSCILHFKSVEHKLCPPKPKFIRADTIISGYFIKTLSTSPLKTQVSIISQVDIKGSIPGWVVNSVSQKAPKEWVNNLMKGCEKVRVNKK